jgi:hypothetical protein
MNNSFTSKVLFILVFFLVFQSTAALFSGGDGSSSNPYEITNCQELQDINSKKNYNYELISDIDCSKTRTWNSGSGFIPIGDYSNQFKGSLRGRNHTIKNLYIDRSGLNYVGLFGLENGSVSNLGLINVNISGSNKVGGITGYSLGGISSSFTTGVIEGEDKVAGIAGQIRSNIVDTYSTASIRGDRVVGGLVGLVDRQNIKKSYSVGRVEGDGGGLAAKGDINWDVKDSYWDTVTSGKTSGLGTGLNTGDMQTSSASSNMEFDYSKNWRTSYSYPKLKWQERGDGTSSNPFLIFDCYDLQAMNNDLDAHYQLNNNIDCSITKNWNSGKGFKPIGSDGDPFTGSLNGDGYLIEDLFIDRARHDVALIGRFNSDYEVTNIGLKNIDFTGEADTGGIVGALSNGTISKSFSEGQISGTKNVGGVAGGVYQQDSKVSNSYSRVDVSGSGDDIGGLVGDLTGEVSISYSTGTVSGGSPKGGLIGSNEGGSVTDSYWNIDTSGLSSSDGGSGLTTSQMTYPDASDNLGGFDFSSDWIELSAKNNDYPFQRIFCGNFHTCASSMNSQNLIVEQGSNSWDIEAYYGSQSYSDAFLDRVSGNSDFVIAPFYNESDGRFSLVVGSEADTDRDVQLDLQNLPSGANVPYSNDDNSNSNSRISGRPEFSVENGHEPEGDWSWGSCCPDGGVLKLPDNWDSFQIDPDTSIGVGPNLVLDTEGMYQDLSHSQTITIINGGNPEIVDININSRRSSGDSIIDVEYSIDSSADLDKCTLEAFEGGSNSKTYNSNTGSNPCIFTISETDLAEWSAGDKIDLELNATDNNGYSASETASSSFIIPSLNLEYSGFLFDFDRPYDGIVLSEVGTDLFGFDVLGNYSKEYSVEAFSGSKIDASFQNYTNGTDTDLPSKQRFLMNLEGSSPGFTTLNLTLTDESTGVKKRQKFEVRVREYRSGSREVPGMTAFQILIVSLMVFILKVGYVRR